VRLSAQSRRWGLRPRLSAQGHRCRAEIGGEGFVFPHKATDAGLVPWAAECQTAAMFEVRPLTEQTWSDLEELFDLPGGSIVRGCWCMFYRTVGQVNISKAAGPGHKQELHALVSSGVTPGLVGYADRTPVGWISLGPRGDYRKLERSRVMKAVDETPVWSIVCTFVAKGHRGHGYQHKLLEGAVDFARDQGVRMLEAYPVDKPERSHDDFMFFGSRSLYERAGFREVVRRSPTRLVMRRALRPRASAVVK
jgi:GNAT superfamily N-acetyltransferase